VGDGAGRAPRRPAAARWCGRAANGRLHAAGVTDQVTLRELDRLCLPPVEPLSPRKGRNDPGTVSSQRGGIRRAARYPRPDRAGVGDWPKAADRNGAEVV